MSNVTYYGSKISDNLARTPEGFLICRNVPIARIGVQQYLGTEIGLADNNIYEVEREPTEVFSPATIASFEGKPFCDEHPANGVTPDNAAWLVKGTVQNVRQGSGSDEEFLLADIVVYDKPTIQAIEEGKREISCGYNCNYEPVENGGYRQTAIVGNHVALVQKGRAGARVAIKDEKPKDETGGKKMPSENKKTFWGKMIGLVRDHAPEDLEMAVDEMTAACANDEGELTEPAAAPVAPKEERPENPVADETPEGNPVPNQLEERLTKMETLLAEVVKCLQPKPEPDALDELEEELKGKVSDGEEGEENTPNNKETNDEEGSGVIEEKGAENENAAADSLAMLKQMKPLVAGIKDPKQRKAASDTLARLLRSQMGKPQADAAKSGAYSLLLEARKQAHDSKAPAEDERDLGHQWAASFNPHYKKEVK